MLNHPCCPVLLWFCACSFEPGSLWLGCGGDLAARFISVGDPNFQLCKEVERSSSCSSADGEHPEFLQPGVEILSHCMAWHGAAFLQIKGVYNKDGDVAMQFLMQEKAHSLFT